MNKQKACQSKKMLEGGFQMGSLFFIKNFISFYENELNKMKESFMARENNAFCFK
jgi:hypothetical protein